MTQTMEQFVTLGLGREVFAVPVQAVREILDMRPMTAIPEAPAYFGGLIDVRGESIPVIDLRRKLGLPEAAASENTRILVTSVAGADRELVLGLVADRVIEVIALETTSVEAAPDIGVRWRSDYIRGIGRNGQGFVIILDLARLFATEQRMYLGDAAAAFDQAPVAAYA